ncbi:hypothetical protein EYC80_002928 [Monilinia laxa]|uniref:Uncharacterized protein n=1 Tax=Monilinia laxa TaxID=61186 RepID=A0A5N6KCB0_MONLA|nr:hypothetical protein EYC80_002928 [Monilinia laxa]
MSTPLPAHTSAHLTAAELLLLRPAVETLEPTPYAPMWEPLAAGGVPAATNLTRYIRHTREEIQEMVGRRGPPAAGNDSFGGDDPGLEFDVPSGNTNIKNAISKYIRMNATGTSPVTAVESYTRLATTIPTHNITPLMIHGLATLGTKNLANQTTHIFMPVTDLRYGRRIPHHTLIVISPITKTVDWLDSSHGDMGPHNDRSAALFAGIVLPNMRLVGQVLNFVSQFLGPTTKGNHEFNPRDWRMRFNGSDRQNDTEPSGLAWPANEAESAAMVCTNALCIAAGYNLDYLATYDLADQAVWMGERRGRISIPT